MERKNIAKIEKYLLNFWGIIYAFGGVGISQDLSRPYFLPLTGWNLFFSGICCLIVVFLSLAKEHYRKTIILLIIIGLLGFFAEVVGVNTSLLFGKYYYTSRLGFSFFGVPLILFLNWITVPLISCNLANRFFPLRNWKTILTSALILVVYDVFLEQFAIHFGLWVWPGNVVPLFNYITWFGFGILLSFIWLKIDFHFKSSFLLLFFLFQLMFFLLSK